MICMKNLRFSSRPRAKVRRQGPPGSARAQPWYLQWVSWDTRHTRETVFFCVRICFWILIVDFIFEHCNTNLFTSFSSRNWAPGAALALFQVTSVFERTTTKKDQLSLGVNFHTICLSGWSVMCCWPPASYPTLAHSTNRLGIYCWITGRKKWEKWRFLSRR